MRSSRTPRSVASRSQHDLKHYPNLQWDLFFVIVVVSFGSLLQRCLPAQIPYTVAVLVIFMLLGICAQNNLNSDDCPWHAWAYASTHEATDHHGHNVSGVKAVSEAQWERFTAVGYNAEAFCVVGVWGGRRSCGDGSSNPAGCRYAFAYLDAPFKVSPMLPTGVRNEYVGFLSADELWTVNCNLLRDMLKTADIDPHYLLTLFLPALLHGPLLGECP